MDRETAYRLRRHHPAPAAGSKALDAGCGIGSFTRRLAAGGVELTGVDPDASALAFAKCVLAVPPASAPFGSLVAVGGRARHRRAALRACGRSLAVMAAAAAMR